MKGEISALQGEMPDTKGVDATLQLDFDVEWKDTEILIPLIEFKVRQNEIKLDLPQVKMSNKEFIFHTPFGTHGKQEGGPVSRIQMQWNRVYSKMV